MPTSGHRRRSKRGRGSRRGGALSGRGLACTGLMLARCPCFDHAWYGTIHPVSSRRRGQSSTVWWRVRGGRRHVAVRWRRRVVHLRIVRIHCGRVHRRHTRWGAAPHRLSVVTLHSCHVLLHWMRRGDGRHEMGCVVVVRMVVVGVLGGLLMLALLVMLSGKRHERRRRERVQRSRRGRRGQRRGSHLRAHMTRRGHGRRGSMSCRRVTTRGIHSRGTSSRGTSSRGRGIHSRGNNTRGRGSSCDRWCWRRRRLKRRLLTRRRTSRARRRKAPPAPLGAACGARRR